MKSRTKEKETINMIKKVGKRPTEVYKLNNVLITMILLINEVISTLDTHEERD